MFSSNNGLLSFNQNDNSGKKFKGRGYLNYSSSQSPDKLGRKLNKLYQNSDNEMKTISGIGSSNRRTNNPTYSDQ